MNARREFASTSSSLFLIDAGHERALGHDLRLRQHERAERERIEREAVDVRGHHQAQHRPRRPSSPRTSGAGRPAVRSSSGPNTGATTRERRHRQQRGTAAPSGRACAGRRAEEQRVGERHRHEHVAGHADRVARAPAARTAGTSSTRAWAVRSWPQPTRRAAGDRRSGRSAAPAPYERRRGPAYHSAMHPAADNPAAGSPRYLDRELSWLEFNARVLALAENAVAAAARAGEVPRDLQLQPRRVLPGARLRPEGAARRPASARRRPTGIDQVEQLRAIRTRVEELVTLPGRGVHQGRRARAAGGGRRVHATGTISTSRRATQLTREFDDRIFPVLTPLAVDPAHPFPYISSLSLNLAVVVRDASTGEQRFARVKVPPLLPRFVAVPGSSRFVPLEQVIAAHLDALFPGHGGARALRVPRHPRRRLRALRRRRRPARRDGVRAPAAHEVRCRGAPRGRRAR